MWNALSAPGFDRRIDQAGMQGLAASAPNDRYRPRLKGETL
jgi:hypothetical protein